jgi:hypothetical protein
VALASPSRERQVRRFLNWLARDDQIDWWRAIVDSCSIRAVYGGEQSGPNPTDWAKRGSKPDDEIV